MKPSKALSPQRRRKTVPLPYSSGEEALWEPGSGTGAAPHLSPPQQNPSASLLLDLSNISVFNLCDGPF